MIVITGEWFLPFLSPVSLTFPPSKLAFNTHFPWEDHDGVSGATAMEYSFRSLDPRDARNDDVNFYLTGIKLANNNSAAWTTSQFMTFNGVRDGIIYRQAIMRRPPNNGVGYILDLADIVIPGGVIRVDRARLAFEYELSLGHYGLPGRATVSSNGRSLTAHIPGRSVALIMYRGWDTIDHIVHSGLNAETPGESTLLYLRKKRDSDKNPAMEIQVCVMLHECSSSSSLHEWTSDELDPIASIDVMDIMPITLSALGVRITLRTGQQYVVDFANIDGERRW